MEPKNTRIASRTQNPRDITDEELFTLLQARDPYALTVLIHRFAARTEATLVGKFGSLISREDVRDIVVDTMIHLFKTGERFDPRVASAATWVNVNAHYQALQFLRKNDLTDYTLDEIAERIAVQVEIDNPHAVEQPSVEMGQLLQRLTPLRAEVIRLHYYQGLSIELIADLLKIKYGTVKSHLSRARSDLRKMLENED